MKLGRWKVGAKGQEISVKSPASTVVFAPANTMREEASGKGVTETTEEGGYGVVIV